MNKFRNKTISMLIATDVAARGIDVDDVSHVFHFDLPDEIESYTHRSGRTGRAGKSGISIALIAPQKSGKIKLIEKKIGKPLELVKAPSGQDICGMQLLKMIKGVQEVVVNEKEIAPFVAQIHESLADYTKEELIERFVSVEFNTFLKEYAKSGDINVDPSRVRKGVDERFNDRGRGGRERGGSRDGGDRRSSGSRDGGERRSSRGGETNTKRVFINVGKMDGFENNGQLLGFLCNQSGVDGGSLGKIDLFDSFAFVGVDDGVGEKMISTMNGQNIENRDIRVEFSQDKPQGDRGGSRGGERRSGDGDRRSSGSRDGGGERRRRDSGSSESRGGGDRNFKERRRRS
jgi:ATP-dependent RNA helicase DeaD